MKKIKLTDLNITLNPVFNTHYNLRKKEIDNIVNDVCVSFESARQLFSKDRKTFKLDQEGFESILIEAMVFCTFCSIPNYSREEDEPSYYSEIIFKFVFPELLRKVNPNISIIPELMDDKFQSYLDSLYQPLDKKLSKKWDDLEEPFCVKFLEKIEYCCGNCIITGYSEKDIHKEIKEELLILLDNI